MEEAEHTCAHRTPGALLGVGRATTTANKLASASRDAFAINGAIVPLALFNNKGNLESARSLVSLALVSCRVHRLCNAGIQLLADVFFLIWSGARIIL